MVQYISKDALVAEIDRRIGELSQLEKASYEIGLCDAYKIILSFLDTLEVKEVDLDREITQFLDTYFPNVGIGHKLSLRRVAKHFFELGINTRKI